MFSLIALARCVFVAWIGWLVRRTDTPLNLHSFPGVLKSRRGVTTYQRAGVSLKSES